MTQGRNVTWKCPRRGATNDRAVRDDDMYLCDYCKHRVLITPYLDHLPEDSSSSMVSG